MVRPPRNDVTSRLARAAVHAAFRRIEAGRIDLHEAFSARTLGFGPAEAELRAEVVVHDPAFYGRIAGDGSIGLGASYADGLWDTSDLMAALRIAALEIGRLDRPRRIVRRLGRPLRRLRRDAFRNTVVGARRNIAAHYDLGNDLFELFLDRDPMVYSCAPFERADDALEVAQRAKVDRVCRALELGPDKHLLEIGGGQDYRELEGRFDRLASIEMIEAVGWQYLDLFFERCSELLAPDGLFFLQAICTDDRAYEAEEDAPTFLNRLIFLGGCLSSVEAIARSLAARTDLRTVWLEDISASYVLTLRAWRERFLAAEQRLAELGYHRRFRRLWELYLAISAAGFAEARIMDVQMLFAKPAWRSRVGAGRDAAAVAQPA